jgi:putative oxidoreductase
MASPPRPDLATSIGLLMLRLGAGGLLLYGHGWGKLMNAAEKASDFANPIGLGNVPSFWLVVFAEVLCSSLVMVGLLTRLSSIPLVIFFSVAGFIQHAHDPWARRELPFLYGVPFLALLFLGGGRFSLDAALGTRWTWGRSNCP